VKNDIKKFRGLSLFASAGIAEFGFKDTNIEIHLSSELIQKRMDVHKYWHPEVENICGDISDIKIKNQVIKKAKEKKIDFVFATPPCQGVSLIGKNKTNEQMLKDDRNYLIFDVFDVIDKLNPKAILIENVTRYFKLNFSIENEMLSIEEIIRKKYSEKYLMEFNIFNAADFSVPQNRQRAFIRMWKRGLVWSSPIPKIYTITLKDAISHLPSLESGGTSNIKNHNSRFHSEKHIILMKHTPTGQSAFQNKVYIPINEKTGEKMKGFAATYKRMSWDKPAPTITMRNDCISSQSNVHPGRKLEDGSYSDARVLTLRELFILMSLDPDLDVPDFVSDIQIRHMIGEAVPPRLIFEISKGLIYNDF